eukprot:g44889.t1
MRGKCSTQKVVDIWNLLPSSVVVLETVNLLKRNLDLPLKHCNLEGYGPDVITCFRGFRLSQQTPITFQASFNKTSFPVEYPLLLEGHANSGPAFRRSHAPFYKQRKLR